MIIVNIDNMHGEKLKTENSSMDFEWYGVIDTFLVLEQRRRLKQSIWGLYKYVHCASFILRRIRIC